MYPSSHTAYIPEPFRMSCRFYYLVTDLQGNILAVNPFFQQQFSHITMEFPGKKATAIFLAENGDKFKRAMQECQKDPGNCCGVDLELLAAGGMSEVSRWELSAGIENGMAGTIHAIGCVLEDRSYTANGIGSTAGEMAERYNAYEHSAEALWRFDFRELISASAPPDEIIAHCVKHGYMAECNDNMVRMYGYEKPEELLGVGMGALIDMDAPMWRDYIQELYCKSVQE